MNTQTKARYESGKEAFARGVKRLGQHSAPCKLSWCKRPECRGYLDAMKAAR